MKAKILNRWGIISNKDVTGLTELVVERIGRLNRALRWNDERLNCEARKCLKTYSQIDACDFIVKGVSEDPAAYIYNWDDYAAYVFNHLKLSFKSMCYLLSLNEETLLPIIKTMPPGLSDEKMLNDCVGIIREKPLAYLKGWAEFDSVIHDLSESCKTELNDEWIVNVGPCKDLIWQLITNADYTPALIMKELVKAAVSDADRYLIPYKAIAKSMYEQIHSSLQSSLPEGYSLRRDVIVLEIENLIYLQTPMDSLLDSLMSNMQAYLYKFVSVEKLALSLLGQIKRALPKGLELSNSSVQSKIEQLIVSGASMEDLLKSVMEDITREPFSYVRSIVNESAVDCAQACSPPNRYF